MHLRALLITLVTAAAVTAGAEVTSTDLIGEWAGGTPSHGDWRSYTFRADHSFDGIGGDAVSAGKWKLHDGKKLELIYHYDDDRKPISSSSPRGWILIESISKGRMRLRWYSSFDGKLLPPEVWTKKR